MQSNLNDTSELIAVGENLKIDYRAEATYQYLHGFSVSIRAVDVPPGLIFSEII